MKDTKVQQIGRFCAERGIPWQERVMMAEHTTFRIGGPAAAVFPETAEALRALVVFCRQAQMEYIFVGNGSNLLVSDRGSDKLMIFTTGLAGSARQGETGLAAECGLSLARLAKTARENGLSGLEFAAGIPGTVGAGVCMNCGAYGGEMVQVVTRVDYIKEDGSEGIFTGDALAFRYRGSVFSDNPRLCAVRAYFALSPDEPGRIQARMDDFAARRTEKQPLNYPSAGSVFKRPEGYFAGKLIEDSGLKGKSIGGAQVSPKHAGFIVNTGGATCDDVRRLIAEIQQTVRKNFGVSLECEIKMID